MNLTNFYEHKFGYDKFSVINPFKIFCENTKSQNACTCIIHRKESDDEERETKETSTIIKRDFKKEFKKEAKLQRNEKYKVSQCILQDFYPKDRISSILKIELCAHNFYPEDRNCKQRSIFRIEHILC